MTSCAPTLRPLALRVRPSRMTSRQLGSSGICIRQLSGTLTRAEDGNLETSNALPRSAAGVEATILGSSGSPPANPMSQGKSKRPPAVDRAYQHYKSIADSDPQSQPRGVFSEASLRAYLLRRNTPPTADNVRLAARKLRRRGVVVTGDRRSRLAKLTTPDLPFESLPYECFQEAMKVLRTDRQEKVDKIVETKKRIAVLEAKRTEDDRAENARLKKLKSLRDYAAELEILADINDPVVKRKFEDGTGTRLCSLTPGSFTQGQRQTC
jgi:hypothetical protein